MKQRFHRAGLGRPPRGFTLVEMLVAMVILGLMAAFAWRTLDTMVRTRDALDQRSRNITRLDAAMAQWQADLDAIQESGLVPALSFDGRLLRMTRRDAVASPTQGMPPSPSQALRVVAWTLANGHWQRWVSAPVTTVGGLRFAWEQAFKGAADTGAALALVPLRHWQVLFFRNNAWVNPQSDSANTTADGRGVRRHDVPEGVRLQIELPADAPLAGVVTRDWVRLDEGLQESRP